MLRINRLRIRLPARFRAQAKKIAEDSVRHLAMTQLAAQDDDGTRRIIPIHVAHRSGSQEVSGAIHRSLRNEITSKQDKTHDLGGGQ